MVNGRISCMLEWEDSILQTIIIILVIIFNTKIYCTTNSSKNVLTLFQILESLKNDF